MKISEAVKEINEAKTVTADHCNSRIFIYGGGCSWFLIVDDDAYGWNGTGLDADCLGVVSPQDLAHVMDVVQRLLDTPVNDRFSERKYLLRWMNDADGENNYLYGPDYWGIGTGVSSKCTFTESEIEQLKRDNPRWAPAIEAMKEEVKDDETN